MLMLLVMITTTALINAILYCTSTLYTNTIKIIVSKFTSHANDEGKKEAIRSDNDRHKFRCDR
jgi:hypothetical protein